MRIWTLLPCGFIFLFFGVKYWSSDEQFYNKIMKTAEGCHHAFKIIKH